MRAVAPASRQRLAMTIAARWILGFLREKIPIVTKVVYGDPRPCDEDRQSDYAPAELGMEVTITHGNQERLWEEEYIPRRNGEAVDKVEAENGRVDHSTAIAGAARLERAETYEHEREKAGARGAVEPTISFHFAPGREVCTGNT
jgi:hypothetical protein